MTYFTDEQVKLLLKPIHPKRVRVRDGMSHVEGYDIRAELSRVFGFGRWSSEVLEQVVLCERETTTKTYTDKRTGEQKGGNPAWYVVYRTRVRLTIHAPDGTLVTFHDGSHVGESTHPVLGEAHGNALTNSETYALRRAAINLGDQFGLSLYNKGSLDAIVRWTLVRPEQAVGASVTDTDDVPQVSAESPASGISADDESAGGAFDEANAPEPVLAPRDADEGDLADDARTAIASARRDAAAAVAGDAWERPWLEWALDQAITFTVIKAGQELWREAAAKGRSGECTPEEVKQVHDLLTARFEDLKRKPAAPSADAFAAALARLDGDWAEKVGGIADEGEARKVIAEVDRSTVMTAARRHHIRDAVLVRWPGAADAEGSAAA